MSISLDTVVSGSPEDDDDGSSSGSAYVFARNQDGIDSWGQVDKLTASEAAAGYRFGHSVSICVDRLAVGAPNDDDARAAIAGLQTRRRRRG